SSEIQAIGTEIDELMDKLKAHDSQQAEPTKSLEDILSDSEGYQHACAELAELKATLPEAPKVELSDLQDKKVVLNNEIQALQKELAKEGVITSNKERIAQLEAEEKQMAQELAQL